MTQYIKIDGEWKSIVNVYKKINGHWVMQSRYNFDDSIYMYDPSTVDVDIFLIVAEDSYTGKQFYLIAKYNTTRVYPTWAITSGGQYATINNNGKVTILQGVNNNLITVQATYDNLIQTKTISISYDNQLTIEGADNISGVSGNVIALYNNQVVNPTWSITAGNEYATIDSSGSITIIGSGEITISATYGDYSATKVINLTYSANTSSHTQVDNHGNVTTTETTTTIDPETGATIESSTTSTTNADGSTSETTLEITTNADGSSTQTSSTTNSDGSTSESTITTSAADSDGSVTTTEATSIVNADGSSQTSESTTVVNDDGSSSMSSSVVNYDESGSQTSSTESTSTTSAADSDGSVTTETTTSTTNADGTSSESTSTLVENEDGSSSSNSETIHYDENGDTTGSTTNTKDVNADGSSQSTTTNFNESGDPIDRENVGVDTTGNVSTQDIEFDSNGEGTVTGYEIDTTASEGNGKEIEGDGINTEFVPFKFASEGFVLHIVFKTIASEQPRPPITQDTEDSGTNYLYTIVGAKTTSKVGNIWPGFEIRWIIAKSGNGTSGELQLSRTLSGETSSARTNFVNGHNGDNVYDITITYNPASSGNKFIVYNNFTSKNIQAVNKTIQSDLDLELTLGYSTDHNGDPIRHANVTIYEFSVTKI